MPAEIARSSSIREATDYPVKRCFTGFFLPKALIHGHRSLKRAPADKVDGCGSVNKRVVRREVDQSMEGELVLRPERLSNGVETYSGL